MTGEDCSKLRKSDFDDDELANKVAKMFAARPAETNILVIDEIDAFEAHQQTFLALTKAILTQKTNTLMIGIANSVDLPFKKKHSAIAMRDDQLLFEPYSEEQITTIIEEKVNMKYQKFPQRIKENQDVKKIFFSLLDTKNSFGFISKKISKMNGDIRVAFDIMKSSFVALFNQIKYGQTSPGSEETKELTMSDSEIKVTLGLVVKVFNDKYGSKLKETIRRLPR